MAYAKKGSLTGQFESGQVSQILAIYASPSKDIDDIVHDSCCVSLSRRRNEANTLQFRPSSRVDIIGPCVIVMILTVGAPKASINKKSLM